MVFLLHYDYFKSLNLHLRFTGKAYKKAPLEAVEYMPAHQKSLNTILTESEPNDESVSDWRSFTTPRHDPSHLTIKYQVYHCCI